MTQVEIRAQLQVMQDSGLIEKTGQKRGTRYALKVGNLAPSVLA